MSCACCDEVVTQLRQERAARLKAERAEAELRRQLSWWTDEVDRLRKRREELTRTIAAKTGAFTKAKKRIAELKGGAK